MDEYGQLEVMFAALGITLGVAFVLGVLIAWRRTGASGQATARATIFAAIGIAGWLGITFTLAKNGRLVFDSIPPTMLVMMVLTFILTIRVARSPVGKRIATGIPLAVLVAVQGFRLPLELMMHQAYEDGLMPVQMSYSGYNFDIVTGTLALAVAAVLLTRPVLGVKLARAWNWLGLALLANVVIIAILSAPLPFRKFMNEPANVWILDSPFVWLPTMMVPMALLGHLVIFGSLRHRTGSQAPAA
jgi:hypothetical protein